MPLLKKIILVLIFWIMLIKRQIIVADDQAKTFKLLVYLIDEVSRTRRRRNISF